MSSPTKEQKQAWHSDPDNWHWWLFYYNPEDKRLIPITPRRIFGWTVNYANPGSILLGVVRLLLYMVLLAVILIIAKS